MTCAPRAEAGSAKPDHVAARQRLVSQYAQLPPTAPVRLAKKTSNLFRARAAASGGLDVSGLDSVLSVDVEARTADVQAMTTYERLVEVSLQHGLMPNVVPQLKTITLGGAVTGLGIESSSFRNGLPHESVREMEILTGAGEVVVAHPEGPHADLFRAFPNSYGSLGYALRLVIDLEPVRLFVQLRHVRFPDLASLTDAVAEIIETRAYGGNPVDFVDGTVFAADEAYLTLGSWADEVPYTSDYTGHQIYYQSIRDRGQDYLPVRDYLWRWDTDWFWCSRAFGAQRPLVRRLWPKRWLRSDVYSRLVRFENRHGALARVDRLRNRPARERVVQDVEIPLERTAEFVEWFLRKVPITPIWLCPLRLRDSGTCALFESMDDEPPWPLYPLRPRQTYVNVGFWSTVAIDDGAADGDVNRRIEQALRQYDGHKSLYSDVYYAEDEFWRLYGGAMYRRAKMRYDPAGRLLGLYDKAVMRR